VWNIEEPLQKIRVTRFSVGMTPLLVQHGALQACCIVGSIQI
jgi:hypothetical protein